MAVAVHGGRSFGAGEANVTARLPLMVRPSPPRFLNFGDRFELPVVLQNQTSQPVTAEVAVRATNLSLADRFEDTTLAGDETAPAVAGRRVRVPANDRVEVRFPAAARQAGTVRLQFAAAAADAADAATAELPVWTPATTEAFATYGDFDDGAVVQPVQPPADVWEQFGGLEVTTSSTQLQALTDAVLYLVRHPFDSNERAASRVLGIAALRDVLQAFQAEELPSPSELEAAVKADIERLAARQNPDGGFAFWRRGDPSWPYLSIHVAHALARARAKGYEVPEPMWRLAATHLKQIERHIPGWYSEESRRAIRAYALYVRFHMEDPDPAKAAGLLAEAGLNGLSLEALGWLLPTFHAGSRDAQVTQILRHLANRATETAAAAHFTTHYSDGAHVLLHSSRRADAVILEALIQVKPDSDLIPKVVAGLLAHRTAGRWTNTQENAFVLVALDRYFHAYEGVTPDFVARVWLGRDFAGEYAFRGRTTERAHIHVPMAWLAQRGAQPLTLAKEGPGRLYYRLGMRYAPKDLRLDPADYGFAVERVYEAVDDPGDVTRDEDGTWRIKTGARVRVRLTMVAPARRYHVALVDPLPAGLEVVNPELAVSGMVPADPDERRGAGRYWWWYRPWYEHQNLRDERVEAFASLLWEGVHEYTYVARATTPGVFVVPPAKAEEMYHPETFGRTATDSVIVE
jgi:alpha-2-macroglobulin